MRHRVQGLNAAAITSHHANDADRKEGRHGMTATVKGHARHTHAHKKRACPGTLTVHGHAQQKKAASYSPALHRSTIGAGGLNFSVRNGKRWNPAAITTSNGGDTAATDKKKNGNSRKSEPHGRKPRAISSARLWRRRLYTCALSTSSSRTALMGSPNLAAGFALRCFQRLSHPDSATRRCAWRHNRLTGGLSATVLSY